MSIEKLLKRKPKHEYKATSEARVKGGETKKRDPWQWCDADEGKLEDPTISMEIDSEEMLVKKAVLEGETIGENMDIRKMKDQLRKWGSI